MRYITVLAILLVVIPTASAIAEITYTFPASHVEIDAYDCLDASCATVRPFSGSFPDGKITNTGKIRINFPSSLATQYGYAVYYYSTNYLPWEAKATWHTYGDPRTGRAVVHIPLIQKKVCRAKVDNLEVINNAQAAMPVSINVEAGLDGDTHSAFSLTNNAISYIPPHRKEEFYGVDTQVFASVEDAQERTVFSQMIDYSGKNALFAGESVKSTFTFTPTTTGTYKAKIRAVVTDAQCASQETQQSTKQFLVVPARPRNACYTLLNNLKGTPTMPSEISLSKISNYANDYPDNDPNYQQIPVPTKLSYTITDGKGFVLKKSVILPDNTNSVDILTHKESFSLPPGDYTVDVVGKGDSPLCALQNAEEKISMQLFIPSKKTYAVRFTVFNSQGEKVDGARVSLNTQNALTKKGVAVFDTLLPGIYPYTIVHASGTASGNVKITNTDVFVHVVLQQVQYTLTVNVKDKNSGQELNGATILVGRLSQQTRNGKATFTLPSAQYVVQATKEGYSSAVTTVNLDQNKQVSLLLTPSAQTRLATFVVKNIYTARFIAGARITINGNTLTTNASGVASIRLPTGTYAFSVNAQGFLTEHATLTLTQNAQVLVSLTPLGRQKATFTVLDGKTRQPVQDAEVIFQSHSLKTNKQGKATFVNIQNGTFTYEVKHSSYLTITSGVTIAGDANIIVTLPRDSNADFPDDETSLTIINVHVPPARIGSLVPVTATYKNDGTKEIEHVRLTVNLLDGFGRASSGSVNVRPGQRVTQKVLLLAEDVQGPTVVRISVGNGKHTRTIHREIVFY